MKFHLPKLPFERTALSGFLSEETLNFHYGKHHQKYVDNVNRLLETSELKEKSFHQLLFEAKDLTLKNNVEQAWNHTFYWLGISPTGQELKPGNLKDQITSSFDSVEKFKEDFLKSARSLFGSGWVWLVMTQDKKLKLVNTQNAGNPLERGQAPLLVCDVWEHAYYVDFHNDRATYVKLFLEKINWQYVEKNLMEEAYLKVGALFQSDLPVSI